MAFMESFDPLSITDFSSGIQEVKKLTCLPPLGTGTGPVLPWICWYLWRARNLLVFEDKMVHVNDTSCLAIKAAREWQQVQASARNTKATTKIPSVMPLQGYTTTMFTDSSWHEETRAAGLAWVLTQTQHNDEHRGSRIKSFVSTPLVAEALAMLEGLRDCRRLGHTRIQAYFDSLQLINAINSETKGKETYGLVCDILFESSLCEACVFSYVPRSKNLLADSIAKNVLGSFISSANSG